MSTPYNKLKETARRVATVCSECKLAIDVEEYVGQFRVEWRRVVRSR